MRCSDVVVLHQDGQDAAHFVDSVGFREVPEFLQEQKQLTPDDLETGETVKTPRGTFHVTAMSREQIEAAGYGFHHQSDDGKYLIMGNGTRAFAVAAEQAQRDNPLKTAEQTTEQNGNMIDGIINNTPTVDELEAKVKAGEQISLVDLANAVKADKERGKGAKPEKKPSIRAQLKADKAKTGNVATVITKDLSRLGRNYLKTGELIEIVFPEYEVRYIAINDGVDTAREDNEFTPLRNWFNEFYARDTSKKIRAVKQAKAQKGERVNGEAPYGYLIDPDNRNHLIPDPETAHVVKQIFAMYVRGDRMCEIQNWLRDNEILTVGELRYRRTGSKRHPRPQLNAWYNGPDKTLYDILTRKEYLGHTITGKTYKVSYKSKKTKKNPEEKRYFFPNTHEPLIDEETFELAQKRIATRQRPTKVDEIDLFSGLLFCGDCGYKMYAVRGAGTLERKHAYTCGNYRNRARNDMLCTTHYIRKSVLKELVLADLQRVTSYVKEHEQEFIETANECSAKAVQKTLTQQRKELDKAQNRINELNILFRKLYEDNALGKLSDEQFAFLTSGYDEEKKTLTRRIAELSQEIDNATERSADVKRFVALVRRYTAIEELTYENVHEFIDRILIHELDKETNTRKIEIFYSFVGRVDTGDKPTESISYFRQIGADVKSYAI